MAAFYLILALQTVSLLLSLLVRPPSAAAVVTRRTSHHRLGELAIN